MEFDVNRAAELQKLLSKSVIREGRIIRIQNVVGLDISYSGNLAIAVAALLNYPQLTLKEYTIVKGIIEIPYVPGLLAFREAPLMIKACEKLTTTPDLIVVDGHGITHPRKFGIASHIGLVLDIPTIGVAKKLLYGKVIRGEDGVNYIIVDDEIGGIVFRDTGRELYASIGHKISVDHLKEVVPKLFKTHTLPEPTYIADTLSKMYRRS